MSEIRLNGSEKKRRWKWESIRIAQHKIESNYLSVDLIQNHGGTFIHEFKNIAVTFIAAYLVVKGEMTLGMLVAVQYIIGQLNAPILNFIDFVQTAQEAKFSLERILEVKNKYDDNTASDHLSQIPNDADISLKNVTFRFEGPQSVAVLNNLNAVIPYGKVTAIVGASGSGKTTLLKLLLQFYKPTQGEIELAERSLYQYSPQNWLALCGVVMQDGYIFDDTILANITESDSTATLDKERLRHALRMAHLERFISSLHKGLHTPIGQNGIGISGGERQRILIARAVYKNPPYLFFDEATSSLDAESERYIVNNLENFFQQRTVVIIAHRLSTVRHADQILVMENGKLVESGNHNELTRKKGFYYSLVKNQLELGL
jgi:ATP-binding cassette subfamily B protein